MLYLEDAAQQATYEEQLLIEHAGYQRKEDSRPEIKHIGV